MLDYDESPNRTFIVVAYDNGIPSLSSTATVFVRLSNTNKYPPVFDPVSGLFQAAVYSFSFTFSSSQLLALVIVVI